MTSIAAARWTKFTESLKISINISGMSDLDIAQALGYSNTNFIMLLASGTLRLPLIKVAPMAQVLGLDPDELEREWWAVYCPEFRPLAVRDALKASSIVPGNAGQ